MRDSIIERARELLKSN